MAVAAVVKAIAATSLSVFKWFEADRLIAKKRRCSHQYRSMYCVEVSLRQWKSASTAGLDRLSQTPTPLICKKESRDTYAPCFARSITSF